MKKEVINYGLRLLRKLRLLDKINFTLSYSQSSSIKIPLVRGIGYEHFFDSESWLTVLLKKWLPRYCSDRCFFDVGINIGQTLIKVKSISSDVRYVGFEPNPNCLFYTYQLMEVNKFSDVVIFPVALSDHTTILDLNLYSDDPADSSASIIAGFRSARSRQMKVPSFNWQALGDLGNSFVPGIIKIDVEGAEGRVLNALYDIIRQYRPIIICEVLPVYDAKNEPRLLAQQGIERMLESLDYLIARITLRGELYPISEIGIHQNMESVNYVFYPKVEEILD